MKRSAELRDLSVDHHHGLVLARRARRVGAGEDPTAPEAAWAEIERRFRDELEPHFRIEEELLVPELTRRHEHALVDRLAEDHAALRGLASPDGARDRAALCAFGERLEAHIRFEERELFPVVEARFPQAALDTVAQATARLRDAPRSD